jgi:hypothetical protein
VVSLSYSISKRQIKYIKTMSRQVFGGDDEAYREMLWAVAKVKSCKDLKGAKIDLVIGHLEKCIGKRPPEPGDRRVHTRAPVPPQPAKPAWATARQVYEIRELWNIVSRAADKEKALRKFLWNRFGVSALKWLSLTEAQKIIEGLKAMVSRAGNRQTGRN